MRRLDAETLDRFYAELRKRGRGDGKPLSASQVRSVHTVLSGALKQAVAWGWIGHNRAKDGVVLAERQDSAGGT